MLLEQEQFLSKMTLMFEKSRQKKGHVDMVFKRYDGRTKPIPCPENHEKRIAIAKAKGKYSGGAGKKKTKPAASAAASDPLPLDSDIRKLLCRVTMDNEKISTVVEPEAVSKFQEAYCKLLRNSMNELKREKKKKKPANAAKT